MAFVPRSPTLYKEIAKGRVMKFTKNEMVSTTDETDYVMLVVKGFVKRYMISNAGSLGVQIVYGPQDVFSLTKVFRGLLNQSLYDGPEVYYYKAMAETEILALPVGELTKAAESDPAIYKDLFSEAGHHLKNCVHNLENVSMGNSYTRVAHQLLFFAQEFGEKTKLGTRLKVPLTHQDIADILGTTRETVSMAVIKLRDNGLVVGSRHLMVKDIDALEKEAYG